MKISLNWLKKYVDIPESVDNAELIRLIGARLVEVEGVIDETHKYDNIYIVRVVEAEKIPDTHLTLCMIDAGGVEISGVAKNENGLIQVLCGAPNVTVGMLAAWIAPGAAVPASYNDDAPFVIGMKKMLGKYDSNGMLAAEDELDFGEDHEGIIEIDPEMAKPGDLFADVFELNDLILEIENKSLTHRPDCFGIIGFAREVAGILGQKFEEPDFLLHEDVFPEGFLVQGKHGTVSVDNDISVEVENKTICPRYTACKIKITDAGREYKYFSPMQVMVCKSGMSSVSRIVDITNYLMLLTGQPLHAFDCDKFLAVGGSKTPKIGVRLAREGEKLELLDDSVATCNSNDILITSNDVPVALGGAMGGKNTAIDNDTKLILLESASFSLYNLRKTQMSHGIFSEAITRFTKGVPAGGTFSVLAEAVKEIGGKPLALCDHVEELTYVPAIEIKLDEINGLLGTDYSAELVKETLGNVGFMINGSNGVLSVEAPVWRTDIHIKEDVIEEVGRLLGYDNIVPTLPLHRTASLNEMLELKREVRGRLSRLGANELLTYSFVSERLLSKVGQKPVNSYKIINSISPELQYVRQSIVPSLLEKAYINQKLPVDKFAMFEINNVCQKEWGMTSEKVPVEKSHLGFVVAERKNKNTAYYVAKKYVAELLTELGVKVDYLPLKNKNATSSAFEPKRSADIVTPEGEVIGVVGEFRNSVRQEFKLDEYLAGFEIDLERVLELRVKHREIKLGAKETRDLTVTTKASYGEVVAKIQKILDENDLLADILPLGVYQPEGSDEKHISVRLKFDKFDKTIMPKLERI